jgi:hypothetical protein
LNSFGLRVVFLVGLSQNSPPRLDYPFQQLSDWKVASVQGFRMTLKPNFSERLKPPESNSSTKMVVGLAFDFESRANGNSNGGGPGMRLRKPQN